MWAARNIIREEESKFTWESSVIKSHKVFILFRFKVLESSERRK